MIKGSLADDCAKSNAGGYRVRAGSKGAQPLCVVPYSLPPCIPARPMASAFDLLLIRAT